MKIGLKKFVAAFLAVVFLWSTLAMVQAQASMADYTGYMSSGMAEMPAMDGVHRTISDMSIPSTSDMHCDKAGGMGDGCGSHCSLCCASIAQRASCPLPRSSLPGS